MTSNNSILIRATKEKVYRAFLEKNALEYWLAPKNMAGKIHDFDAKRGGGYTMSLFYLDASEKGKTTANEDRFTVTFVTLEPFERIVQAIVFDSHDKRFQGEMTMEVLFAEVVPGFTEVTIIFGNLPPGISPEDNEAGTAQSLQKLAGYLDHA